MLDALTVGIHATPDENLGGVYLRGSLVMGDFDLATSDVDFFTGAERHVNDSSFAALAAPDERLSRVAIPFGYHLEGNYTYMDRATAWRATIQDSGSPTIARNGIAGAKQARRELTPGAVGLRVG